jgi:hypothetical protein
LKGERMLITAEKCREWGACYDDERLRQLYDRPMTALEVLQRKDGEWAYVPDRDRLWTAFRPGVLSDKINRLHACMSAERALMAERARGREPDARSWNAVNVARAFALGEATDDQRRAAAAAADDAAAAAAAAAADDAYAAYAAAAAAADDDAADAAYDASADAAVCDRERAQQVADLIALIESASFTQGGDAC